MFISDITNATSGHGLRRLSMEAERGHSVFPEFCYLEISKQSSHYHGIMRTGLINASPRDLKNSFSSDKDDLSGYDMITSLHLERPVHDHTDLALQDRYHCQEVS